MKVEEIDLLIRVLRQNGVTRFKSKEISIRFYDIPSLPEPVVSVAHHKKKKGKAEKGITVPPKDVEIEHTVDAVKSLLKLSDVELVDRMFPEDA